MGPSARPMKDVLKLGMLAKASKYFKAVHRICPEFSGHVETERLGVIEIELNEVIDY